jgi:hypothetical protein
MSICVRSDQEVIVVGTINRCVCVTIDYSEQNCPGMIIISTGVCFCDYLLGVRKMSMLSVVRAY